MGCDGGQGKNRGLAQERLVVGKEGVLVAAYGKRTAVWGLE